MNDWDYVEEELREFGAPVPEGDEDDVPTMDETRAIIYLLLVFFGLAFALGLGIAVVGGWRP